MRADSVAEAYLALLAERGVEYLFGNAGTDFPPIVEALAKAEASGGKAPQPADRFACARDWFASHCAGLCGRRHLPQGTGKGSPGCRSRAPLPCGV
jgi:hypothetical protein